MEFKFTDGDGDVIMIDSEYGNGIWVTLEDGSQTFIGTRALKRMARNNATWRIVLSEESVSL
jgi:hypothetical protein